MIRLFVCGDIVNMTGGVGFISDELSAIIKEADYSIANLEGPEISHGQCSSKPHQSEGTIKYLHDKGFNMMLLANNHITELGAEGIRYTKGLIETTGLDSVGAGLSWEETYRPVLKQICGYKFAFINVCEAQVGHYIYYQQEFGYAWMGHDGLMEDIRLLKKTNDFVIVFVHTGLEHYPIPLPEVRSFFQSICDTGADAVIGGHPHAPQGYEFYGDKFIVYSLGNFFFTRTDGTWEEEKKSYSLILEFNEDRTIKNQPVFHQQIGNCVELAKNKSDQVEIDRLCRLLSDGYESTVNRMCKTAYLNLCSKLLASATVGEYDGITTTDILKNVLRTTVLRRKYVISTKEERNRLLLRLFENETYRNTIIRALKTKLD